MSEKDKFRLTQEQIDLHGLKSTPNGLIYGQRAKLDSPFLPQFDTLAYYIPSPEKMEVTEDGEDAVIIKVDMTQHHLILIEMRQMLPAVSVADAYRDKIRIRWTFNPGNNFWIEMSMLFEKTLQATFDARTQDSMLGAYSIRNFEAIEQDLGNRSELIDWQTDLLAWPVSCIPLWSWFRGGSTCTLPLAILPQVNFQVKRRSLLANLIQMQELVAGNPEDGEWKDISFDATKLKPSTPSKLPLLEANGYYTKSLVSEIKDMTDQCIKCGKEGKIEYPFEDIVIKDDTKFYKLGQKIPFEPKINFISKVIIITAKNTRASTYNYHSNYSTSSRDHRLGVNPISRISIVDQSNEKVIISYDRRTLDILARTLLPRNHGAGSTEYVPGHNFVCFTLRPSDVIDSNGIAPGINNLRIDVELGDNTIDKSLRESKINYQVSIRIQTWRKLIGKINDKGRFEWSLSETN